MIGDGGDSYGGECLLAACDLSLAVRSERAQNATIACSGRDQCDTSRSNTDYTSTRSSQAVIRSGRSRN